jgi:uncharacterized membrane protein YagU involved in acid resistance
MSLLRGLAAGFVATAPMTAFMEEVWTQLPRRQQYPLPPREITREVGKLAGVWQQLSESEKFASTLAAHFAYRAVCGGVFATTVPTAKQNLRTGIGFGLGVWTASYLGFLPALGVLSPATRHPARRNALMIAAHVVWGGTLGGLMQCKRR